MWTLTCLHAQLFTQNTTPAKCPTKPEWCLCFFGGPRADTLFRLHAAQPYFISLLYVVMMACVSPVGVCVCVQQGSEQITGLRRSVEVRANYKCLGYSRYQPLRRRKLLIKVCLFTWSLFTRRLSVNTVVLMKCGRVTRTAKRDWDDLKAIWQHFFFLSYHIEFGLLLVSCPAVLTVSNFLITLLWLVYEWS